MKPFPKILLSLLLAIILLIGFTLPVNPPNGNWYQQFLPNIGNKQIQDIVFLDSLNGYASANQNSDSSYILKTTSGGDNWQIIYRQGPAMARIVFLNSDTGFAGGSYLFKTTNGGYNWSTIITSGTTQDIFVLSMDTIWYVNPNSLVGGVFLTTDGGASWTHQLNIGSSNPEKIYMFNARIGYISKNMGSSGYVRKTTDGGASWSLIVPNDYYLHIYFADSLTGWKCSVFGMKKTTNGGINWVTQTLPSGGIIQTNGISSFSNINRDTIWANGGYVLYPNNQIRSILNHTSDGGANWLFQIPDTASINNIVYYHVNFTDRLHGWVTDNVPTRGEIHTTNGGDTTFLVGVKQISNNIPKDYKLYQNYPNPFNPVTNIKYDVKSPSIQTAGRQTSLQKDGGQANVKLIVFDITGKVVVTLVNQQQRAGTYQVDFSGNGYSSGVYFYALLVDGQKIETRKMILIK